MKAFKYLVAATAIMVMAVACGPTVHVQKDDTVSMANYKTYAWVDTRASETDNTERAIKYVDISVRNAVNAELSTAGWTEVSSNPDVLVSYDVLVERGVVERSDPVYTQPTTRAYLNPRTGRWSTLYYPSQFVGYQSYEVPVKEGTITISLVDASTDKVVWQGWTTDRMDYAQLTPEEVNSSVRKIFNKFDVASR